MYPISKHQVPCFYCEWVGRKDHSKEHLRNKHPEEKFRLNIPENNLTKYLFRKETTGTSADDGDHETDIYEEEHQINVRILSPSMSIATTSTSGTPSNLSALSSPSKSFKSPKIS